jgi:cytidine deaminase
MKKLTLDDVKRDAQLEELIHRARDAAYEHAYAPYSGFAVGAAARDRDGKIFVGANLENAAYGVVMCAEVGAMTSANVHGSFEQLEAIAVVGFGFYPKADLSQIVTPCGRCRQIIYEASEYSKRIDLYCCSGDLQQIEQWTISEMLPRAFGPETLGITRPSSPLKAGMKPFTKRELFRAASA